MGLQNATIKKRIEGKVRKAIVRKFESALLPGLAALEYQRIMMERFQSKPPEDIYEIFDRLQAKTKKGFTRPTHLRKYVSCLERANTDKVKVVLHAPSRHGKTTVTLLGIIYHLIVNDGFDIMYFTYSQQRSKSVMNEFLWYLELLGIKYVKQDIKVIIQAPNNPGLKNTVMFSSSPDGGTGASANLVLIDDYIKNGEDANSLTIREKIEDWFQRVILSREGVENLSIIVIATRQHNEDLSGYLINEMGYEYIRLAAICDDELNDPNGRSLGQQLWPEMMPLEKYLERKKVTSDTLWELLYQGNMVSDGNRRFQLAVTHDEIVPKSNIITVYGCDLAYTADRKSDYSVCVRLVCDRSTGVIYFDDVIMRQCLVVDFIADMKSFINFQPGPIFWYVNGLEEKNAAEQMRKEFPRFTSIINVRSKLLRSVDTAKEWNAGNILVPKDQSETMQKAISQIELFTGQKNDKDDAVDALVAAVDQVKDIKNQININRPLKPIINADGTIERFVQNNGSGPSTSYNTYKHEKQRQSRNGVGF